jgi:UDP-N-acetyl-L-fucosamine synthase
MKKLKVVTIVGTRPEIIRLCRLIPALDELTEHTLVHTGQNYDPQLNEVFFRDLELRQPDVFLNVDTSTLGSAMGEILRLTEKVLLDLMPDAVMILGDTNSAVAAIIAERMQIPVYHMEAGNRSFDNRVPEELNRRMVDHVATFNLAYTEHARGNLIREGVHPRFVFKTGSPLPEIYSYFKEKIAASNILEELGLEANGYLLASFHRQENVDDPGKLESIVNSLETLAKQTGMPVVVSTHPRTKLRLDRLGVGASDWLRFYEPFGYLDYNKLQLEARVVLSDSGSIAEESYAMGLRSVSIRDSIERPEAIESATILLGGTGLDDILQNFELADQRRGFKPELSDYEIGDFSTRVISILFSTVNKVPFWKNTQAGH